MNAETDTTAAPNDDKKSNILTKMYVRFKGNYLISCEEFPQLVHIYSVEPNSYWDNMCNHWRIQYYEDGTFTLSYRKKGVDMYLENSGTMDVLWTISKPSDYVYKFCRYRQVNGFPNVIEHLNLNDNDNHYALHISREGTLSDKNIKDELNQGKIPREYCEIQFTNKI